jgi:hemerythrin-like domain-containing protein
MDEHYRLLDLSTEIRTALDRRDLPSAWAGLGALADELLPHVRREERGIFTALREDGEFADEVAALEAEHADLDELLSDLDRDPPDFPARVRAMLDDLATHIDRENLGIFPVAVVTLSARGWDVVEAAHREDQPA